MTRSQFAFAWMAGFGLLTGCGHTESGHPAPEPDAPIEESVGLESESPDRPVAELSPLIQPAPRATPPGEFVRDQAREAAEAAEDVIDLAKELASDPEARKEQKEKLRDSFKGAKLGK